MSNAASDMIEVFSSIQGEGLLVGLRQIFLRFHGCTLNCDYCDTSKTLLKEPPEFCQIEKTPGRKDFFLLRNPVPADQVLAIIEQWNQDVPGAHHSVSLTGGEPLLHSQMLRTWLPKLQNLLPIYLETNGMLTSNLLECISFIDIISMDFKIPSTSGTRALWEEHYSFLEVASQCNVFVKAVVGKNTTQAEIIKTCEIIATIDSNIPLILQPCTSTSGTIDISQIALLGLQETASRFLKEIRIIPQTHKFMNLL